MMPGMLQVDIKVGGRGWDEMIPAHTGMIQGWVRAWHMVIFNRNFLVTDVEGMRQHSKRRFSLSQSQARAIGVTVELLGKALDHKEFLKLLGFHPAEKPQEGFASKGGLHT